MLERLERSFKQAGRFSAHAAHELKTPLAILQGQLEHAIHHSAEEGPCLQAELTSIFDEVRRLSTISRKLLLLAQADAGRLNLHREPFDLSKALAGRVSAGKGGRNIDLLGTPHHARIMGLRNNHVTNRRNLSTGQLLGHTGNALQSRKITLLKKRGPA
jgi:signal transduction histidine kinase